MQKIDEQTWESTCPVCEQSNGCHAADGKSLEDCWCFGVKAEQAAFASLAPHDRGARCLCATCLGGSKSSYQGKTTL